MLAPMSQRITTGNTRGRKRMHQTQMIWHFLSNCKSRKFLIDTMYANNKQPWSFLLQSTTHCIWMLYFFFVMSNNQLQMVHGVCVYGFEWHPLLHGTYETTKECEIKHHLCQLKSLCPYYLNLENFLHGTNNLP